MHFEIITPDKTLFNGDIESVTLPGSKGSFQVLKNHAALISSLSEGKIKYKQNDNVHEIMIYKGMVEVLKNDIIVLVESLVSTDEEALTS
jgi:F-type H+-transporting ATPase subunit epsilon